MSEGALNLSMWLIDDDENEHRFVQHSIRHSRIDVSLRCFASAIEARQELQSPRCELPDLIVCDLNMPGLSGDAFLCWLRGAKKSSIPVVIRSTSDLENDIRIAYESGGNAFVQKGMSLEEIDYSVGHIAEFGVMLKRGREPAALCADDRAPHLPLHQASVD